MSLRFWGQWSHSTVLISLFQKQNLKNLKRRTKNDFHKIRHTAQTLMPQGFRAFFTLNRVQKRIQAKALCRKAFRALGVDLWDVAQKPKVRHVHIFYSSKPNHPLPPLPQRLHPRFWLLVFQPTTLAPLPWLFGRCFSIALFFHLSIFSFALSAFFCVLAPPPFALRFVSNAPKRHFSFRLLTSQPSGIPAFRHSAPKNCVWGFILRSSKTTEPRNHLMIVLSSCFK